MLIEAKSTKAEQAPKDGERFKFHAGERMTRLPLYIAMAVLGLVVYLKSIVSSQAAAASEPPSEPKPGPDAPLNRALTGKLDRGSPEADMDPTIEGIDREAGLFGPVGPAPLWPGPFAGLEFPAITFAEPSAFSHPSTAAFFPAAFSIAGFNDNALPGQPSALPLTTSNAQDTDEDDDEDDPGEEDDETDDGDHDPTNRSPSVSGPVRLHDVFAGQVVLIGLSELLFGAIDSDDDALLVTNLAITGAMVDRTVGGWRLTTLPGMLGPVDITYRVTDGEAWVVQTAHLNIIRNVEILTPQDGVHAGSPYDDDIDGLAGDDLIDALAGNDLVVGGDGDDHLNGGTGDDHLFGNAGDDVIFGGEGNDVISGGDGHDRLFGGAGNDTIDGDAGDDMIDGGAGNDIADGGGGNDRILGAGGNDILEGGSGDDILDGGPGADVLLGGSGADSLIGGAGADLLDGGDGDDIMDAGAGDDRLQGGAGADDLDGGDGDDLLDYSAATVGVIFDAVAGTTFSAEFGEDTFAGIEQIVAGAGDDLFVIGATATVMSGGGGRDTFVFEVTDDTPSLSDRIVHEILDFVVGDRVRVRDYDLDREARAREADLFREIYDDDDDDWLISDLPIVVQHVRYDDIDNTIIRADLTADGIYEITINIHGILLPIDSNWTYA